MRPNNTRLKPSNGFTAEEYNGSCFLIERKQISSWCMVFAWTGLNINKRTQKR